MIDYYLRGFLGWVVFFIGFWCGVLGMAVLQASKKGEKLENSKENQG